MEWVRTVMSRLVTINNVIPFPLTIHAAQHIMKLLYPILLQSPLEGHLRIPDPKLLLHLLEEVRSMKP